MTLKFIWDWLSHTLQDYLSSWSVRWQLPISITKCFAMIIGRQPSFDVNISINSISLPCVTSCKDIGVTVRSSLNNSPHIANIVNVAGQRSSIVLYCIRHKQAHGPTQPFIPPGSVNEYQLRLVSGWTGLMQVKLWDPLRTRAMPECLRDGSNFLMSNIVVVNVGITPNKCVEQRHPLIILSLPRCMNADAV